MVVVVTEDGRFLILSAREGTDRKNILSYVDLNECPDGMLSFSFSPFVHIFVTHFCFISSQEPDFCMYSSFFSVVYLIKIVQFRHRVSDYFFFLHWQSTRCRFILWSLSLLESTTLLRTMNLCLCSKRIVGHRDPNSFEWIFDIL